MNEEYLSHPKPNRFVVLGTRISWSAIVAGMSVGTVCQILLTMLGVAIGAAKFNPFERGDEIEGLATGALVWWLVTFLVSLFVGARVAGKMAGALRKKDGALHGFLMWSTATAISFLLAGTLAGGVFTGASGVLGGVPGDKSAPTSYNQVDTDDQAANPSNQSGAVTRDAVNNSNDQYPNPAAATRGELKDAAETVATNTAQTAVWSLVALLCGALISLWSGSMAVHIGHLPRESRSATRGAVTGEPLTR